MQVYIWIPLTYFSFNEEGIRSIDIKMQLIRNLTL